MASNWTPLTIHRWIDSFPTSSCVALVQTDAGPGYLKALGNGEGPHILACELVGTRLAMWLKLPTFEYAIIPVTRNDEIWFHNGESARPGPAFITKATRGDVWSGGVADLRKVENREAISRLVVFDTWTLNCDRFSKRENASKPRIKRDNVFLSASSNPGRFRLVAMDHTCCFTCGGELTKRLAFDATVKDARVYGLFPEFRDFLDRSEIEAAVRDLRTIERTVVEPMVNDIPNEWEVGPEAKSALVELIVQRASFVADTIIKAIWPQGLLDLRDGEA